MRNGKEEKPGDAEEVMSRTRKLNNRTGDKHGSTWQSGETKDETQGQDGPRERGIETYTQRLIEDT